MLHKLNRETEKVLCEKRAIRQQLNWEAVAFSEAWLQC